MTRKNRILPLFLLSLSFASLAFADCKPYYVDAIKGLDGRANPPRTTLIASGGGAALTPVAAAAIGATVAPAALIAAPATALVAGGYLIGIGIKKRSLLKAYKLLREAERGEGRILDRFMRQLGVEDDEDRAEVITWLREENTLGHFCPTRGVLEVVKPMNYRKILRSARASL